MLVSSPSVTVTAGSAEIRASIGRFPFWMRVPADVLPELRGDAFAAWGLFPSMAAGEPLELSDDLPVSPALVEHLHRAQEVFSTWVPSLTRIPIRCRTSAPARHPGVAAFYSGGVDGGYTLATHGGEISHLLSIRGFDLSFDNDPVFDRLRAMMRDIALATNTRSVFIETNVRELIAEYPMRFSIFFGAMLGGVALLLGFDRTYLSSEATWNELIPWGSHPATDHLWSTETSRTIHDGAHARRSEKVLEIARHPHILQTLRVCPEDSDFNCGKCYKCLRTMAALQLHGLTCPTLPALSATDRREIERLTIDDPIQFTYWDDLLRLAKEKSDAAMIRCLKKPIRRYLIRSFVKRMDDKVWDGRLREFSRRFKTPPANPRFQLPDIGLDT